MAEKKEKPKKEGGIAAILKSVFSPNSAGGKIMEAQKKRKKRLDKI